MIESNKIQGISLQHLPKQILLTEFNLVDFGKNGSQNHVGTVIHIA